MNVTTQGQTYFREERMFIILLATLFMVLSVSAVFYIRGEIRHNDVLMEYQAEKAAAALLELYRAGTEFGQEEIASVAGFGIYDSSGQAILAKGKAPGSIVVEQNSDPNPRFSVESQDGTISLLRPTGMLLPMMGMRGRAPRMSGAPAYVYSRVYIDTFLVRRRLYLFGYALIPLVIASVLYFVGRLYYRNWQYRHRIESQRNLVHLGEAARTLSHEIKNPLSAIRVQAAVLKKLSPPDLHEDIAIIEEEVIRMQALVDRIGEFLRNPEGSPESIELASFVRDVAHRYSWEVEIRDPGQEILVLFDGVRLRSVLENLVTNAFEASKRSGAADPEIVIEMERQKDTVRISVLDSGEGLPAGRDEDIFDPFFTTKDRGSGIGLAIAKRFTQAAGGTLRLLPRKTGGVEARLVLPIARSTT